MDTVIVPHISQKEICFLYIFGKKFAILCKINGKCVNKFPSDYVKPCVVINFLQRYCVFERSCVKIKLWYL